jgi:hypothetical protein
MDTTFTVFRGAMSGLDLTPHYSVLLLETGASLDQVKQAFRSLSRHWHPDQYISDPEKHRQALSKQTRLNEAYAAICKELEHAPMRPAGTVSGATASGEKQQKTAQNSQNAAQNNANRPKEPSFTAEPDCGFDFDEQPASSSSPRPEAVRNNVLDELVAQGKKAEKGDGCTRDLEKAVGYYRQAARMGSASACFRVACIYMNTNNEVSNQKLAAEYFQQAVNCGHLASCFNLALMYERGVGVKRDLKKALDLYRMAASVGDQQARRKIEKLTNQRTEAKPGLSSTFAKSRDCYVENNPV